MHLVRFGAVIGVGLALPVLGAIEVYSAWPFDAKEASKRQAETSKALKTPVNLSIDLGGVPLKLVLIPAGKFMMGSPESERSDWPAPGTRRENESPQHEVTITHPFCISAYKITQAQYEAVTGSNPSKFTGKDNPVDAVTWNDAVLFCKKASAQANRSVRLPTEAQWEYAARAGTATRYFFGDDEGKLDDYVWYRENAKGGTHPVGQKLPNAWGLYDVHGLLWEYCSDLYRDSYVDAKDTDPEGPASGTTHATRGGTYGSRPPFVRSAIRIASPEGAEATKDMLSHFGFRVVVDLQPTVSR